MSESAKRTKKSQNAALARLSELLESRELLAINLLFNAITGHLELGGSSGANTMTISANGSGNVTGNGVKLTDGRLSIAAADVKSIVV